MGLWKTITKIFKEKELKARNFVEIYKTTSFEDSNEVKSKLEKYKISVYVVNKVLDIKDQKMLYILRIPEPNLEQAKKILNVQK
jgi:hypothetical protein